MYRPNYSQKKINKLFSIFKEKHYLCALKIWHTCIMQQPNKLINNKKT